MRNRTRATLMLSVVLLVSSHAAATWADNRQSAKEGLVGAWRSHVQFKSGAFASVKDLEFLYAFNKGGTMTESSNYDASPPVAPAYGTWRKVQPRQYEARYEFFLSKAPKSFDAIAGGGGWLPGGRGVLVEKIVIAEDGRSFKSTIRLDVVDETGKVVESGSEAEGQATRLGF